MPVAFDEKAILAIERPNRRLMQYYILRSLLTGPAFPITVLVLYFRYHTLRYRFDAEGISMRWGILFRREVILNYNRIQDIHLTSGLIERWLGLARVQIQTASGSASAEMTIEGLTEFEAVRDFIYSKMRGLAEATLQPGQTGFCLPATNPSQSLSHVGDSAELASIMKEICAELRTIRLHLERANPKAPPPTHD